MSRIQQTVGRGTKQLTVIPQAGLQQGVLSWPEIKTSKHKDFWFQMGYKLKRKQQETNGPAKQVLCVMLRKEDSTESGRHEKVQRKMQVCVILPKKYTAFD